MSKKLTDKLTQSIHKTLSPEPVKSRVGMMDNILGDFEAPDNEKLPESLGTQTDLHASTQARNDASLAPLHARGASLHANEEKLHASEASLHASTQASLHANQYPSWRDKVNWNHRITPELYDEIMELAQVLRVSLKELNELALVDLIKKYKGDLHASTQARNDAGTQDFPLINEFKELNNIELIILYSQISGRKISKRDRDLITAALKVYSPLLLELGIREAGRYAKEKGISITSFTYCSNAAAYRAEWNARDVCSQLAALRSED